MKFAKIPELDRRVDIHRRHRRVWREPDSSCVRANKPGAMPPAEAARSQVRLTAGL